MFFFSLQIHAASGNGVLPKAHDRHHPLRFLIPSIRQAIIPANILIVQPHINDGIALMAQRASPLRLGIPSYIVAGTDYVTGSFFYMSFSQWSSNTYVNPIILQMCLRIYGPKMRIQRP